MQPFGRDRPLSSKLSDAAGATPVWRAMPCTASAGTARAGLFAFPVVKRRTCASDMQERCCLKVSVLDSSGHAKFP